MDYSKRNSIIMLIMAAILFSCADSPEAVLKRYLNAVNKCDYKTAYKCLCQADRDTVSLAEYSQSGSVITEVLGRYAEFRIADKTLSPTGSTVTIQTQSSRIDLLSIYKRVPALAARNLTEKQIKHLIRQNSAELAPCRLTSAEDYTLILEDGSWKVSADLGRIKHIKQQQQIAIEYEKRGMFDEALKIIDKLAEIGGINDDMSKAYLRIADKQDYITKYLKISKIFTNDGARIVVTNNGTYGIKTIETDIMYEKNGTQYNSHQTSQLVSKPFIGSGEQYTFHIDFNGGTIMDITRLEARITNVEF